MLFKAIKLDEISRTEESPGAPRPSETGSRTNREDPGGAGKETGSVSWPGSQMKDMFQGRD